MRRDNFSVDVCSVNQKEPKNLLREQSAYYWRWTNMPKYAPLTEEQAEDGAVRGDR